MSDVTIDVVGCKIICSCAVHGSPFRIDEAVVSIFIAGRNATTLPKKMFESIRLESDPVIAVVSSLLIGAVLLGVLTSVVLRRRPAHAA